MSDDDAHPSDSLARDPSSLPFFRTRCYVKEGDGVGQDLYCSH